MNNAAKELNDLYAKLMRSIEDADELQMQLNEMLAKQKLSNKDLIDAGITNPAESKFPEVTVLLAKGGIAQAQAREAQQEFCEKLVAERPTHPRGTWRKWIEANCEFSYGQARSYITRYEQETNRTLIMARNAGRRTLAWNKIKDRAEQFGEEVLKPFCRELFDSLEDDDERFEAQLAMTSYLESCCESVAEDGKGHQGDEENYGL